ncbi:MAG: YggS family pyridoxal phosphate-dependent enzyme [Bacteroidales bacterium]
MDIKENLLKVKAELPVSTELVAVSKFHPVEEIMEAYDAGQRIFGENRPQELKEKAKVLPKDIQWHFIGNLQTNKIKMVVPYVKLIHSVSSEHLLFAIEKYCANTKRDIDAFLELHIAQEESKSGFSDEEMIDLLKRINTSEEMTLHHVHIKGLMSMASFTSDEKQVRKEFQHLIDFHKEVHAMNFDFLNDFDSLSFGMSNDYKIAYSMGSTYVRVGTKIFGPRN